MTWRWAGERPNRVPRPPLDRRLSQAESVTGLFRNVAVHRMHPARAPEGCNRHPAVARFCSRSAASRGVRLADVPGDGAADSTEASAAVDGAMKGAGVVWLSPDRGPTGAPEHPSSTGPVWHVWSAGACYLLTGPGEQPLPGIVDGARCQVTARDSAGGRAITWAATVETVDPAGPEWRSVAPKLAAGRLNGGDPVVVVSTWPGRLTILCLRPTGDLATARTGLPDGSQAAVPLPSPATTP